MSLPKPYYESDLGKLYHWDALDILPYLGQVDLLLCDPPYGLNSKMNGGTWGKAYSHGDMLIWDYVIKQEQFDVILKAGNVKIIWGANNYHVPPSRCWFVWVKPQIQTLSDIELAWTNIDAPSKIYNQNRISMSKGHPTQKPTGLMIFCINKSKTSGIVLDPFIGSGTTAVACERLKRRWIGIEIEEKYCAIAVKRIEAERKQLKLW